MRGGKINMGPLPGKFVTVPVALNFLSIALNLDMGIFRRVAYFLCHSLTNEAQQTFPTFDLCVPMLMYEYGNMASASPYIYTQVKQEVMDYCLNIPKHSDQLKK